VDALGNAYVTGVTQSADFPITPGAFQTTVRGDDGFVTKLDPTGARVLSSTFVGGSGQDWCAEIAIDAAGNVYLTGATQSTDFPTTPGTIQSTFRGLYDAVVLKLNATFSALVYSSYLGGTGLDAGVDIAVDAAGTAYVGGYTGSTNFPVTPGAFQTTARGNREGFVARITHVTPPSTAPGKVSGAGIVAVGRGHAAFAFVVQRKTEGGAIKGNLHYVNHTTRAHLKALTFTSLSVRSSEATLAGTCTVNGSPCTFVVAAVDGRASGSRDSFTITVSSAPPEGGPLRAGNIRIHK
jgi:beta-propeller repeat-containing protein